MSKFDYGCYYEFLQRESVVPKMVENGETKELTHLIFATDLEKDPHFSVLEKEA